MLRIDQFVELNDLAQIGICLSINGGKWRMEGSDPTPLTGDTVQNPWGDGAKWPEPFERTLIGTLGNMH